MIKPRKHHYARVIFDSRNAYADHFIDKQAAQTLYERGLISYDLTNNAFCIAPSVHPHTLLRFANFRRAGEFVE